MKKSIFLGMLIILVFLLTCGCRTLLVQTSDKIVQTRREDGSITMGIVSVKGKQVNLVWAIMGSPSSRALLTDAEEREKELAIALVSEQIEKNPRNVSAYINRAALFFERGKPGDFEKAITDCNAALRVDKNEPAAYYIRGLAYANLGNWDDAISDLVTILSIRAYENIGIYYVLGQLYMEKGMINNAIEMLEKVAEIDSDFYNTNEMLAMLRMRQ